MLCVRNRVAAADARKKFRWECTISLCLKDWMTDTTLLGALGQNWEKRRAELTFTCQRPSINFEKVLAFQNPGSILCVKSKDDYHVRDGVEGHRAL